MFTYNNRNSQKIIGIVSWDRLFSPHSRKGFLIRELRTRLLFTAVKHKDVSWMSFSLPLALSWLISSPWTWTKAESMFLKLWLSQSLTLLLRMTGLVSERSWQPGIVGQNLQDDMKKNRIKEKTYIYDKKFTAKYRMGWPSFNISKNLKAKKLCFLSGLTWLNKWWGRYQS